MGKSYILFLSLFLSCTPGTDWLHQEISIGNTSILVSWSESELQSSDILLLKWNYPKNLHPLEEDAHRWENWFVLKKEQKVQGDWLGDLWYLQPESSGEIFLPLPQGAEEQISVVVHQYSLGESPAYKTPQPPFPIGIVLTTILMLLTGCVILLLLFRKKARVGASPGYKEYVPKINFSKEQALYGAMRRDFFHALTEEGKSSLIANQGIAHWHSSCPIEDPFLTDWAYHFWYQNSLVIFSSPVVIQREQLEEDQKNLKKFLKELKEVVH